MRRPRPKIDGVAGHRGLVEDAGDLLRLLVDLDAQRRRLEEELLQLAVAVVAAVEAAVGEHLARLETEGKMRGVSTTSPGGGPDRPRGGPRRAGGSGRPRAPRCSISGASEAAEARMLAGVAEARPDRRHGARLPRAAAAACARARGSARVLELELLALQRLLEALDLRAERAPARRRDRRRPAPRARARRRAGTRRRCAAPPGGRASGCAP